MKMAKCLDETMASLEARVVPRKEIWDMGLDIDHRKWDVFAANDEDVVKDAPATKEKLRPIQDIVNRIKWDESYNVEDYVVGYEDRFDGVMEINLQDWKTEQTDLEFIPTHRIVWIKKKGDDGERVWDRRMKHDGIFGSGVTRKTDNGLTK